MRGFSLIGFRIRQRRLQFVHIGAFPDDSDLVRFRVTVDPVAGAKTRKELSSFGSTCEPGLHVSNCMRGNNSWHIRFPLVL